MGLLDNLGDKVAQNADSIKAGIDKAGDLVDEKTGDKYADKVDKAQDFAKEQVDKLATDKK